MQLPIKPAAPVTTIAPFAGSVSFIIIHINQTLKSQYIVIRPIKCFDGGIIQFFPFAYIAPIVIIHNNRSR